MVKFLLDQNLSPQTADFLRELGWTTKDIRELGKSGASDPVAQTLSTTRLQLDDSLQSCYRPR